jgi:protein SCO1/2
VEPLKELVFGRPVRASGVAGWLNGIRLFCTVYDPKSGRYHFDYSIFVGFGIGLLCLGGLLVFVLKALKERGRQGAG